MRTNYYIINEMSNFKKNKIKFMSGKIDERNMHIEECMKRMPKIIEKHAYRRKEKEPNKIEI